MPKKRFKKQLMAMGLSRNGAEECASACRNAYRRSYAWGLVKFRGVLRALEADGWRGA